MQGREFAIAQALARAALIAAAALPADHPSRGVVRHQVDRMRLQLTAQSQDYEAEKIASLLRWFDDGAVPSTERVVLSEG
jgi:hypothetical protein